MAEKGAHLSATYVKKPSIFELIAQDTLANTFYPAFKHVVQFLVSQNHIKYNYLDKWFEEFYLGFNLLIQFHYLRNYDATFAERFYSLRRISINSTLQNANVPLTTKQRILSLLFSVVCPYVKNKIKIAVENLENGEQYENFMKIPKKYRKQFLQIYKIARFILESLCMIYYLRYMIGRSETHSLSLMLSGITLVYCHEKPQNNVHWRSILKEIMNGNWRSCIELLSQTKSFFGQSLELSAFFIQFLNWWHSEQLHAKFFAFPIPPAPQPRICDDETNKLKNICPLCKNAFQIPTALPVSGYVFCFMCIRNYVLRYQKCPVTGLPAHDGDLIRIYQEPPAS